MKDKLRELLRNFSYTLMANALSISISIILILIVPKYISIIDYGFWQLYVFYSSYTSYMSLGLTDGIYLRYGGKEYRHLEKPLFVSQFWFLILFNFIVYLLIITIYGLNSSNLDKIFIVVLSCISGMLLVPRSLLNFTLQATNRIKEYSVIILIERLVYFILVVSFLFIGIKDFRYLIVSDLIGKTLSLVYGIYISKELVFGKLADLRLTIIEIKTNISVGIKLLIANLSSLLIIGIVRFFIEKSWGVETFGKVSLTLSISNILMVFINAISIVLFPVLRRISKDNLVSVYELMRTTLLVTLFGLMVLIYPIQLFLSEWLPNYSESFMYLSLLFPLCIFESKTSLLINTYLKTLRKESMMLKFNLFTVCLSFFITIINIYIIKNLTITILSIVFLLAIRSIISEIYLGKILKIRVIKNIILEILLVLIFILVTWYFPIHFGVIIYITFYIVYLLLLKGELTIVYNKICSIKKLN